MRAATLEVRRRWHVRGGGVMRAGSLLIALLTSGCLASISAGPPRLYPIDEEIGIIRQGLRDLGPAGPDETSKRNYRNNMIAARMYAIDIQYTAYESALTKERQGVGFGAAVATIGLTTASTLVPALQTKDILTGTAGAITGARAAYENDILLAHSVQWIQSQMRARRADIAGRILDGTKRSTDQYPLAAALSDLEAYYRAGTFTGGVIATTETLGADARFSEEQKDERLEVTFRSSSAVDALTACVNRGNGAKARLLKILPAPATANFSLLISGQGDVEGVLAKAREQGICP